VTAAGGIVASRRWALLGDDRRAVPLKVVALVCCLLAAALLEVPW